jgi:predicted RNA binding protein YcfA (HicA-like mRNA interferase family)
VVTRDFSGEEIYRVLVNAGGFQHVRTTGDHLILRRGPPDGHDTDSRIVSGHNSVSIETLRSIADSAGANDFEAFCRWGDSNR